MNNFLKNLFNSEITLPPASCVETFERYFADTMNAEWFQKNQEYEVIFLKDKVEHIAIFSSEGVLLRYKVNMSKALLPVQIINSIEDRMEIMNALLIKEGENVSYEIIARFNAIDRFRIIIDELGSIRSEEKL